MEHSSTIYSHLNVFNFGIYIDRVLIKLLFELFLGSRAYLYCPFLKHPTVNRVPIYNGIFVHMPSNGIFPLFVCCWSHQTHLITINSYAYIDFTYTSEVELRNAQAPPFDAGNLARKAMKQNQAFISSRIAKQPQ